MKKKIDNKIIEHLFILALIVALVMLSVFYIQAVMTPKISSEEEHTTIVRAYGRHSVAEVPTIFLDIEHRLYPDTIVVAPGQTVELNLTFKISMPVDEEEYLYYLGSAGASYYYGSGETVTTMEYFGRAGTELLVEIPRMPSGCMVSSHMTIPFHSNETIVTVRFDNPTECEWIVGRPLVKIYGIVAYLTGSLPDDIIHTVSVEVTTAISTYSPP